MARSQVMYSGRLVVPAAAVLAIVLMVTLPLGVLLLMVFLAALYLAKMPVAVWIGQRLLQMIGQATPSPYVAIVLGLIILYTLAALTYFIGDLVWLAATWLGLGAIILTTRTHLLTRQGVKT